VAAAAVAVMAGRLATTRAASTALRKQIRSSLKRVERFALAAFGREWTLLESIPALTGLRTVIFELGSGSLTLQVGAFLFVIEIINLFRKLIATTKRV